MFKSLRSLFNPDMFQGWGKQLNYFEGWYFKILTNKKDNAFAIIPGIAFDKNGEGHSFIQVLDGKLKTAEYHKFETTAFSTSQKQFDVQIGNNHFNAHQFRLDLPNLKGELLFEGNVPWPNQWYSPGIMGPYTFAPFMECYHGIVSMNHKIKGTLLFNGREIDFSGGKGYIEKDWGRSFPKAYIWLQSNHFTNTNTSLKLSIARIPWVNKAFNGFIAGLWYDNKLIQFTTYNKSQLHQCILTGDQLRIQLSNRNYKLQLDIEADQSSPLISPINGAMSGKIEESMYSRMTLQLYEKETNKLIYSDRSENVCLEIAGQLDLLLTS